VSGVVTKPISFRVLLQARRQSCERRSTRGFFLRAYSLFVIGEPLLTAGEHDASRLGENVSPFICLPFPPLFVNEREPSSPS
jgi:hypothetical protein